jgi:hypothetical protein
MRGLEFSGPGAWSGVRLYCNRYEHFKDPLVCAVTCPYRRRCGDFALFYADNREPVNVLVLDYYAKNGKPKRSLAAYGLEQQQPVALRELYTLEIKRIMPDNSFVWIGPDGVAEVLELDDILRRAENGEKAKHIFKVAQEMELRFQLVPRKRIQETKRKVEAKAEIEAERAAARKTKLAAVG